MNKKEEEKIIKGFERYTITPSGTVNNIKTKYKHKPYVKNGYYMISLQSDKTLSQKQLTLHRLVALTFIDNPKNHPYVNHKNGIKTDNNLNNLEWITQKQNIQHALKTGLITPHTRSVEKYSINGTFINEFSSVQKAADSIKLSRHSITVVCRGKNKTAGGFIWKYKEQIYIDDLEDSIVVPDYPNYYVSKNGNVYSKKRNIYLKPQLNASGYHYVTLCDNMIKRNHYVHQLVGSAFIENFEKKKFINHIDSNKINNNVTNLEWTTNSENMIHMHKEKRKKIKKKKKVNI
jgi:hypothetical protein